MKAKLIVRLAYVVVAVAVLVWASIGAAIWLAWRIHQETAAANAIASTASLAAPTVIPEQPIDRSRSSVQYRRLDGDEQDGDLPPWLARELDPIPTNARSMSGWVTRLRAEGVQVCWQMAPVRPGESDFTFALPFERASVREVLDELCRCDSRYRWEWMEGSEVINLLIDEKLDVPLGDVSFRSKRLYYCQSELSRWRVNYGAYGVDPPRSYVNVLYWPVAIKAREITVRDYLNLVVSQYDQMTWSARTPWGLVEFDAPQATRDAVVEKYRDEVPDEVVR